MEVPRVTLPNQVREGGPTVSYLMRMGKKSLLKVLVPTFHLEYGAKL